MSKRKKGRKTRRKTTPLSPVTASPAETGSTPAEPRRDRRAWVVPLVLAAITVAAYAPVFTNDFVNYDDDHYITANPNLRLGLSWEGIRWAFTASYGANWFPLTWLSWLSEYQLFGFSPFVFHSTNLLLHVLASLLLFLVFDRMTGGLWQSAFVAAIFALHPMHVESVAWAAERKDVLSGLFWILTLWAYLRYVERRGTARYLLVALALALGLMSKPMLVTLPFVLLLLDVWPLSRLPPPPDERGNWRALLPAAGRLVVEKVPLFAIVLASSIVTFFVQRAEGAVQGLATYAFDIRAMNALNAYGAYLLKAVWPSGLSVYYPHPGEKVSLVLAACNALLLIAITMVTLYAAIRRPERGYLPVGWLWFVGTLVPVIGLVQVGQQAMADRYTYIPYIGLSIVVAWGVSDLLSKRSLSRPARLAAAGVTWLVLLFFAGATFAQARVWKNSVRLFEQAVAVTENNQLAQINLGVAHLNAGRLPEADEHLTEALRIADNSVEAQRAMGVLRSRQDRTEEALEHLRTALRLEPGSGETHQELGNLLLQMGDVSQAQLHLREALSLSPRSPDAFNQLGAALLEEGNPEAAIDQFQRALDLEPGHRGALHNWGLALAHQGRYEEAIELYRKALEARPDYRIAHLSWARTAFDRGSFEEAIDQYRKALELEAEDPETLYWLGLALAKVEKPAEAAASFQRAIVIDPTMADAHFGLGLALARTGELEGSVRAFEKAVELSPEKAEAHYSLGLALAREGRFDQAIEHYRHAISLQSDYAAAYNSWGTALASGGQLRAAIERFRKATEADPGFVEARNNWGRALVELGRPSEAVEQFRSAVSLEPENADAHNNLGVFLARQGRLKEAVESFRRAVELAPDHPRARANLESTLEALNRP